MKEITLDWLRRVANELSVGDVVIHESSLTMDTLDETGDDQATTELRISYTIRTKPTAQGS